MGYFIQKHAQEELGCIERLSAAAAPRRWKQEQKWMGDRVKDGERPAHVTLSPSGKSYELESLTLWPADGVR